MAENPHTLSPSEGIWRARFIALLIFFLILVPALAYGSFVDANRLSVGSQRELMLRVAYEQYEKTCGSHCIVIDNYYPLGLKDRNGNAVTPADFARAQALSHNVLYHEDLNSNLDFYNVSIADAVGSENYDWRTLGA